LIFKGEVLQQQFLGRWIALSYRATHAFMAEQLKKLGIGYGQFPFLSYLNRVGSSSQEEISQALFFDKATTARAIKKLEVNGYVVRRISDRDHRRYEVKITPKGAAAADEIRAILKDWNERLMSGFSPPEKASAIDMMVKIAANAADEVKKMRETSAGEADDGGSK